jgi:type IV secretion system protein VirB10
MRTAEGTIEESLKQVFPSRTRLDQSIVALDPRATMESGELLEASRLSYPLVALPSSRKEGVGAALGAATALLLGAATFVGLSSGREAQIEASGPQETVESAAPTLPAPGPVSRDLAAPVEVSETSGGSLVYRSAPQQPLRLGGLPMQAAEASGPSPLSQRFRSPTLVVDTSGPVMTSPPASDAPLAGVAGAPRGAAPTGDEFAMRVDASAGDTASARSLAAPGHTVVQGTLIPAVLETAINSDVPGYVRALVSQDVRSFDGKRVLIPRSSRLIGQYRSGLAAGQRRAYVLWSRLIRPDGVSVALASPATDESGQAGLTGKVDSHFFQRFGSALLLSVVGAAGAVGTGGASLMMAGSGAAAGSSAQQSGSIPPTVRVRQGQPIRVFTARDLDFSTVRNEQ